MPGICGVAGNVLPPDLGNHLAAMQARMRHYPWYVQQGHCDAEAGVALGRTSLGYLHAEPQPVWNRDRTLLAVMEGEFFDEAEIRNDLLRAGHRFLGASQAELLLRGYEWEGKAFLRRLNGSFVAALWDARERQLVLVNDRFGMKPLYYARVAGRLPFATEIKALLVDPGVSRKPSRRGLAQFFTFGHLLANDTLFEDVLVLPAAACLTYDVRRDRLLLEKYWQAQSSPRSERLSDGQHLDRIDEAFQRAVDRRVTGTRHLGLSLSGGLDARTILGVIDHDRIPLTTLSMGIEGSIDLASAQRLAEIVKCRHHVHLLDTEFLAHFEDHLRRMTHLTDGQYLSQCIVMPTLPLYRELGIEVLLRGHAGELMHGKKAYNFSLDAEALAATNEEAVERWLMRRMRAHVAEAGSASVFGHRHHDLMESLASTSLHECFAETAGIEPLVQRVSEVFLGQRVRRETAMSMVKFGSLVETRLPYLDNELIDALRAAPPALKLDHRIQSYVLRRRRPEFLQVVNANTGATLEANPLQLRLAQVRLKVFAKLGVRGYQPYERLGLWLRRELRPLVARLLLDEACLDQGVFDADRVRGVVREHLNGKRNHVFLVLALMVYEMGRRTIVHGDGAKANGAVEASAPGALLGVS